MPVRQSFENYYTAAQAMKAMGVTEGTFYNFIRNGGLEGVKLPGRKQNVYEKSKVDKLAEELKAFSLGEDKETANFTEAIEGTDACKRLEAIEDRLTAIEQRLEEQTILLAQILTHLSQL